MSARRPGVDRSLTLVFAALGGEGGGLLSDWIIDACTASGLLVQATSIPGVAQRTGSTTYYMEFMRAPESGDEPLFGLYPAPGYVDMAVATDLVEAARLIEKGYVTPDRTTLIASTHRVYAMSEKTAMGDGAFHAPRIHDAARRFARHLVLRDFSIAAREHGTMANALLLGAMVADERFPVGEEALEAAIRGRGVAVEANLRGLAAGRRLAEEPESAPSAPEAAVARASSDDLSSFPEGARDVLDAAIARLADYQDDDYARLYLERVAAVDRAAGRTPDGVTVTREAARYLALWMTYEDVMRVADLKSRATRRGRIRREAAAKDGEPVRVTEFFKPGIDEFSTIAPRFLTRWLTALAERRGGVERFHVPLHIRSDTILGHAALRFVASLGRRRRRTSRFSQEQRAIERWLAAIDRAAPVSSALGLAIARCGQIVKGYGDTRIRAMRNLEAIYSALIDPAVERRDARFAEPIDGARLAALADDEGKALRAYLAAAGGMPSESDAAARNADTDQQDKTTRLGGNA